MLKRRSLSLLLAFAFIFALVPVSLPPAAAATVTEGNFVFTSSADGLSYTLTSYTGSDDVVQIPASCQGKPVSVVGAAFSGAKITMTSVVIPETVVEIAASAFSGCGNLTAVKLPNGLKTLGKSAFSGCTVLGEVIFGDELTFVGDSAFSGCTRLTKVVLSPTLRKIPPSLFTGCTALVEVNLAQALTEIGNSAFSGCTALKALRMKDESPNIRTIGTGAFQGCTRLVELTFPAALETIGDSICSGDTALTEVILPEKLTSLGKNSFTGCTALAKVTLPDSIIDIETGAFQNCSALTKVVLPKYLTVVKENSFSNCGSLSDVVFGNLINTIDKNAFTNSNLGLRGETIRLPKNLESIGESAFSGCRNIQQLDIPNGVERIADSCFSGCLGLRSISLPASVTAIGKSTFSNCAALTSIDLPAGLTVINDNLLSGCAQLEEVHVYGKVNAIENGAFSGCNKLRDLWLPGGLAISENIFGSYSIDLNRTNPTNRYYPLVVHTVRDSVTEGQLYSLNIKVWGKNKSSLAPGKFLIIDANLESSDNAEFQLNGEDATYDGRPKTPGVSAVTLGGKTLVSGDDYAISYTKNVNRGTASVHLLGVAEYYEADAEDFTVAYDEKTGQTIYLNEAGLDEKDKKDLDDLLAFAMPTTLTARGYIGISVKSFDIIARNIEYVGSAPNLAPTVFTYTGLPCRPTVTFTDGTLPVGSTLLVNQTDYKISYENNVNAGTATIKIDGINNYTGSISQNYSIGKRNLNAPGVLFKLSSASVIYTGREQTPGVLLDLVDDTLSLSEVDAAKNPKDFKVEYQNNVNAGTASVIVTGINSCEGQLGLNFNIEKSPWNAEGEIAVNLKGWKAGTTMSAPTLNIPAKLGSTPAPATITYKYSTQARGEYGTAIPATAGTYYVLAEIVESANFKAYTTQPTEFKIEAPATFKVQFTDGGKTNKVISEIAVEAGQTAPAPANPTLNGYTFTGWDQATTNIQKNLVIKATWKPNQYDVRFNPCGGKLQQAVASKFTYELSYTDFNKAKADRKGYRFEGWFTAAKGGTKVTSIDVKKAGSITLYAHWSTFKVNTTFNANGGTVEKSSAKTIARNSNQKLKLPKKPIKKGFKFKGWYTKQTGGKKVTKKTAVPATGVTYYAQWKK